MNAWLRLWHDMPTDPKWRVIARKSGRPIPEVLAVFTFMLTHASQSEERGSLEGWVHEDIAAALDIDEEDVAAIFNAMEGRVHDGLRLTGWEKRQPKREDDGSAERKRLQRERERLQREREKLAAEARDDASGHTLSRDVTHGHDVSRDVTLDKRREDTDKNLTTTRSANPRAREPENAGGGDAVDVAWKVQSLLDTARPPSDEDVALVSSWLAAGLEPDEIVEAIRERKGARKVERIRYFEKPMRELADAARERVKDDQIARDPKTQRTVVKLYQQAPLTWDHTRYGAAPGEPGCLIDPAVLREFGYAVWEWSDGSWQEAA